MFNQILCRIGGFSNSDVLLFEKSILNHRVSKGAVLIPMNEICQTVYFVISGSFIQYTSYDALEQNVIELYVKNDWVLNHQSFVRQEPSQSTIEAFTDSDVFSLNIHTLHGLIAKSPSFFQLGKLLESEHSRIKFFDQAHSPLQKYNYLLEHRKELIQTFPLKTIASYLKIAPETLSRAREKVTKGIS